MWDVESDTPEEAPSFFLLPAGIFCRTSRSTFSHTGGLLRTRGLLGRVDLLRRPRGASPEPALPRTPLHAAAAQPLAQACTHLGGRHRSESNAVPLFSGIKGLDPGSHMNRTTCKQGLQLFS